jgi:predicted enzyme related to lactoylglutathione lyase
VQAWGGGAFDWSDTEGEPTGGTTAWFTEPEGGDQFAPSNASCMVDYRVDDLHALVAFLKAEGCNVIGKIDDSECGKFGWVIDPEGSNVELWEPPAGRCSSPALSYAESGRMKAACWRPSGCRTYPS